MVRRTLGPRAHCVQEVGHLAALVEEHLGTLTGGHCDRAAIRSRNLRSIRLHRPHGPSKSIHTEGVGRHSRVVTGLPIIVIVHVVQQVEATGIDIQVGVLVGARWAPAVSKRCHSSVRARRVLRRQQAVTADNKDSPIAVHPRCRVITRRQRRLQRLPRPPCGLRHVNHRPQVRRTLLPSSHPELTRGAIVPSVRAVQPTANVKNCVSPVGQGDRCRVVAPNVNGHVGKSVGARGGVRHGMLHTGVLPPVL
mmetsp:Transcript_48328/g.105217  ORF Transcript_48328/g.105217 Transcript_48328/m.105217 type:complete len:251 (-) Transcript_48328:307-1059(-)